MMKKLHTHPGQSCWDFHEAAQKDPERKDGFDWRSWVVINLWVEGLLNVLERYGNTF